MKQCCRCLQAPGWHFASNTTRKRADGLDYFLFTGCQHAMKFAKEWGFIAHHYLPAYQAKWNEEAERMFEEATKGWTEPQRARFRVQVLKEQPAASLALGDRAQGEGFED